MSFPTLTFPLTVDFGGDEYWIEKAGPYKYGEAVTAFFTGEDFVQGESHTALMEELEVYLKTFGCLLQPYPKEIETTAEQFDQLKRSSADCSVNYAFHRIEGGSLLLERYTFPSLRSFLYVEMGKAILRGNAPRKCRLCGNWFLHEHGERAMYCGRVAPGETKQTCREVGARAVFEKKIQDEDAWKLYKRAYKKYYARVMNRKMEREDFDAWAKRAAQRRDLAAVLLRETNSEKERERHIEALREALMSCRLSGFWQSFSL